MRALLAAIALSLAACSAGDNYDPPVYLADAALDGTPDACVEPYTTPCNPLQQTGCPAESRCTWIRIDEQIGRADCGPVGTKALGEPCGFTRPMVCGGFVDDCGRGAACTDGICRAICDHQGGSPACEAGMTCERVPGLFAYGGAQHAGTCVP